LAEKRKKQPKHTHCLHTQKTTIGSCVGDMNLPITIAQ